MMWCVSGLAARVEAGLLAVLGRAVAEAAEALYRGRSFAVLT